MGFVIMIEAGQKPVFFFLVRYTFFVYYSNYFLLSHSVFYIDVIIKKSCIFPFSISLVLFCWIGQKLLHKKNINVKKNWPT